MRGLLVLALLAGCATPLEEGFEASLTRGYSCGQDYVVLTDGSESVKLRALFAYHDGEEVPVDERLLVFTGARLVPYDGDYCDDMAGAPASDRPRLDCTYEQASGVVTARIEDDLVAVVTEGVVLRPEPGAACGGDVVMSDGALTAVPLPGPFPL